MLIKVNFEIILIRVNVFRILFIFARFTNTLRCGWSTLSGPGPSQNSNRATPLRCSSSSASTSTPPSSTSLSSR